MAAQKPQQKGFFLRAREWLRRRRPRFRSREQIVILPRRARCFGGRLTLSLPADFIADRKQKELVQLHGAVSGLELTLMQIPFRRRIRTVSALDLQLAFRRLGLPHTLPQSLDCTIRIGRYLRRMALQCLHGTARYLIRVNVRVKINNHAV